MDTAKKLGLYLLIVTVIGAVSFWAWQIKGHVANYTENKVELTNLQKTVAEQAAVISEIKSEYERITQAQKNYAREVTEVGTFIQKTKQELHRELEGKASLSDLAKAKPKLVEKSANAATQLRLRCLEIASGSPKKVGEDVSKCTSPYLSH